MCPILIEVGKSRQALIKKQQKLDLTKIPLVRVTLILADGRA
jgi:hypothetical protein